MNPRAKSDGGIIADYAGTVKRKMTCRHVARFSVVAFWRIGLWHLASHPVICLANSRIHVSILCRRFISGLDTFLSIDEISTVFEPSANPSSPYPTAHRRLREALTSRVFIDAQWFGHVSILNRISSFPNHKYRRCHLHDSPLLRDVRVCDRGFVYRGADYPLVWLTSPLPLFREG